MYFIWLFHVFKLPVSHCINYHFTLQFTYFTLCQWTISIHLSLTVYFCLTSLCTNCLYVKSTILACVRPDTVYVLTPCVWCCKLWHPLLWWCMWWHPFVWHCISYHPLYDVCLNNPLYDNNPLVCFSCHLLYNIVYHVTPVYDLIRPVSLLHRWPVSSCMTLCDLSVWPCVTQFCYCFSSHCAQASELPPSPHVWEWPPHSH